MLCAKYKKKRLSFLKHNLKARFPFISARNKNIMALLLKLTGSVILADLCILRRETDLRSKELTKIIKFPFKPPPPYINNNIVMRSSNAFQGASRKKNPKRHIMYPRF